MRLQVPKLGDVESQHEGVTQANPFTLPKVYLHAQQQRVSVVLVFYDQIVLLIMLQIMRKAKSQQL
jgi:hypothetical protein